MSNETMLSAYIEAALFTSTDESRSDGGDPLDKNYGREDLAPETLAKMQADVDRFSEANADDIGTEYEQAGHDFWLTRNRHGAGFWDGDWEDAAGKRLTDAAHAFGEVNLYVGDDGLLYC